MSKRQPKSKRRERDNQEQQGQGGTDLSMQPYVLGANPATHVMSAQSSAAGYNIAAAQFAALSAHLPRFGAHWQPPVPQQAQGTAIGGEARLAKLQQQLQTQFSSSTVTRVVNKIRLEQAQYLSPAVNEEDALEYLLEYAVMAATADPGPEEENDGQGAEGEEDDVQFDADMNAVRVLALETADRDRERRKSELRCEFVRGDIMDHEELRLSVLRESLAACSHFTLLCSLTLPRCNDTGGCAVCDPSQRQEAGESGASSVGRSQSGAKAGKATPSRKRSGGTKRTASQAEAASGHVSTARERELRGFKLALADLWRLEADCIKWYAAHSHPYLREVGAALAARLTPLLSAVGRQEASSHDERAPPAQRTSSAADAATARPRAVEAEGGTDASCPPLRAAERAVREQIQTMKEGVYEQTEPGRLPTVVLEAYRRSDPSAALEYQDGSVVVIDD